jgi:hypothetical protein
MYKQTYYEGARTQNCAMASSKKREEKTKKSPDRPSVNKQ